MLLARTRFGVKSKESITLMDQELKLSEDFQGCYDDDFIGVDENGYMMFGADVDKPPCSFICVDIFGSKDTHQAISFFAPQKTIYHPGKNYAEKYFTEVFEADVFIGNVFFNYNHLKVNHGLHLEYEEVATLSKPKNVSMKKPSYYPYASPLFGSLFDYHINGFKGIPHRWQVALFGPEDYYLNGDMLYLESIIHKLYLNSTYNFGTFDVKKAHHPDFSCLKRDTKLLSLVTYYLGIPFDIAGIIFMNLCEMNDSPADPDHWITRRKMCKAIEKMSPAIGLLNRITKPKLIDVIRVMDNRFGDIQHGNILPRLDIIFNPNSRVMLDEYHIHSL